MPRSLDVGRQLGRSALQCDADRIHDYGNALAERFANLAVVDGNCLWHAFNQVASLDFHRQRLVQRIRGPDLDLDLLGRALANQQVVLPL